MGRLGQHLRQCGRVPHLRAVAALVRHSRGWSGYALGLVEGCSGGGSSTKFTKPLTMGWSGPQKGGRSRPRPLRRPTFRVLGIPIGEAPWALVGAFFVRHGRSRMDVVCRLFLLLWAESTPPMTALLFAQVGRVSAEGAGRHVDADATVHVRMEGEPRTPATVLPANRSQPAGPAVLMLIKWRPAKLLHAWWSSGRRWVVGRKRHAPNGSKTLSATAHRGLGWASRVSSVSVCGSSGQRRRSSSSPCSVTTRTGSSAGDAAASSGHTKHD